MKYILNFFGSILCFIIGFIVATLLFALSMMNSTEFLVKEDMVKKLVMDIEIKNLIGEESFEEITASLEKSGIPKEYVNYVIENEEIKEYLGDYASNAVNYILYEKDLPVIESKELTELLIKSFDSVVARVNDNQINVDKKVTDNEIKKVHDSINKYVPKIVDQIPDIKELAGEELKDNQDYQNSREQINQFVNVLENIKKGYDYKYVLVILIIVGLALMLLIKFKSPKLLNWLWRPFVTAAILCLFLAFEFKTLMNYFYPSGLEFLRKFIENNINRMCDIWRRDGFIYLAIIVLLISLKIILKVIKNKKENKQFELEDKTKTVKVEEGNVKKSSLEENEAPLKKDELEKVFPEEEQKGSQE